MAEQIEALVVTDGEGAYYAVPRAALDGYRVADADRDAFEESIGVGDVQGFGSINTTRSNIKHGGSMTSLGMFSVVATAVAAPPAAGVSSLAIKENGVK